MTALLQMQQALRKQDLRTLTSLLPAIQGHPLESGALLGTERHG